MTGGINVRRPIKVLTRDEVREIHLTSLRVLQQAGAIFEDAGILKRLEEAGSDVDYGKQTAKIPEYLVKEVLRKAPSSFTLSGRNRKYDVHLGDGRAYARTCGGQPFLVDRNGLYRDATKKDTANLTRLADGLNNIDIQEGVVDPQDVPHEVRDVHACSITFRNTEKPVFYQAGSPEAARAYIKMASVIAGDENQLKKRPTIAGRLTSHIPLGYTRELLLYALEFIKREIPIDVVTSHFVGATTPVTLAGTLVEINATLLAGVVMTQLLSPGTPVMCGAAGWSMDMKTTAIRSSPPEGALMVAALAQLAKFYSLPSGTYTAFTDSKLLDQQTGYEKAAISLLPLLAGINVHWGAGVVGSAIAASYEQLVIDNEILGMLKRMVEGISVNDDTLAVDLICRVGPRGNYLGEEHTVKYLLKEHWMPRISEKRTLEGWRKAGAKDIAQKAWEVAEEILKSHYPEPLDEDVQKELDAIVKNAEERIMRK